MSRYEALLDRVVDGATAAIEQFDVDQLEHLVRHSGLPAVRFRDQLIKHIASKTRRDAAAQLGRADVEKKLAEIEEAERQAWDRRARLASGGLPPQEMPVHLDTFSIAQLVDCQLSAAREQWLAELQERRAKADAEAAELRAKLEVKRAALTTKLEAAARELDALQHVRATLQPQRT